MSLNEQLDILRQQWRTAALVTTGVILLALVAYFVVPSSYTARTALYVSAQGGDTPQAAYQGAQLSEQRVKSYTELVAGDRVLSQAAEALDGTVTTEQLSRKVTADSALDSVLIEINATDPDPSLAANIANAVAYSTRSVVEDLERPVLAGQAPPVIVRIVQPAVPPTQPSSPGLAIFVAVGVVAGVAAGISAAFLRRALDRSIKIPDDLAIHANAPLLGVIARDSDVARNPLVLHDRPHSVNAEAYRMVRANLRFTNLDSPSTVLSVTSALMGEGKSTFAANLAIAVAATGTRVLLIEGDLRRPTVSSMLGLDKSVGLTTVLTGRSTLRSAVQCWAGSNLHVLSSGSIPPNPSELLGSDRMRQLVREAGAAYEIVLIDTAPVLAVSDGTEVAKLADGVIFVCRYRSTNRTDVMQACSTLRSARARLSGAVLSMTPRAPSSQYRPYEQESEKVIRFGGAHAGPAAEASQTLVNDRFRSSETRRIGYEPNRPSEQN